MTDLERIAAARADIPFLANATYFDNASVTPISRTVQAASDRFNTLVSEDLPNSKKRATEEYDRGRHLASLLVNTKPENIAYVQNTSHGLSLVALGIDWREGDNLVVYEGEFPSNFLCWLQLAQKGVEIRTVSAPAGRLDAASIEPQMDSRTRLVAVSQVQFATGFRVDLATLGALCKAHSCLLVVDGTQSVGAVSIDVAGAGVDVLVTSAHKWMMGPRGIGFASLSDKAMGQVSPAVVGWMSVNEPFAFNRTLDYLGDARRFEAGTPNGPGIFGLTARLAQLLELGSSWIESRVLDLNHHVFEEAQRRGLNAVFRFERAASSGIAILRKPGKDAAELNDLLASNRVYASVRNNALRIAGHYYNTEDEIGYLVSLLAEARA